jgi:hypothetical protein
MYNNVRIKQHQLCDFYLRRRGFHNGQPSGPWWGNKKNPSKHAPTTNQYGFARRCGH